MYKKHYQMHGVSSKLNMWFKFSNRIRPVKKRLSATDYDMAIGMDDVI